MVILEAKRDTRSAKLHFSVQDMFLSLIHISRYLDRVANGALHPAGCRPEPLCDLRIQHLRHRVDDRHVPHRQDNTLPQVLLSLIHISSAKMAAHILAAPMATSTRQANFTASANTMF